jgi:predicted dehydrogenase
MGSPALAPDIDDATPLSSAQRWRVGLIGAGVVSSQYLESLQRLNDLDLVAIADLDADKAAGVAATYGVRAGSVDDVIGADDIDVVLNLTIPAAHVDVSTRAIEAGKHVYVEKPLSLTVAEGRRLLDLAQERGLRVGCAPDTVLGTGVQTARHLIDAGRIGTPIAATASWSSPGHELWHPAPEFYYQPGGGPLFDMGPYYISALVTLLGPIERVTASTRQSPRDRTIATGPRASTGIAVDVDTHVVAIAEHVTGAISTLMMSFEVWGSRLPRIEVYGTDGTVSVPDPNRFDGTVEILDTTRQWSIVPETAGYAGSARGFGLADMVRAAAVGMPHRASGILGLHVVDVMAAITQAAGQRGSVELDTTLERPLPVPFTVLGHGHDAFDSTA